MSSHTATWNDRTAPRAIRITVDAPLVTAAHTVVAVAAITRAPARVPKVAASGSSQV